MLRVDFQGLHGEVLAMNQEEKQKLFFLAIHANETEGISAALELIFEAAQKDARESILKAVNELTAMGSISDPEAFVAQSRGQQAMDTLRILGEWCELDSKWNGYTVNIADKSDPLNSWVISIAKRPQADMNGIVLGWTRHVNIYGSSHSDCLAKGAQWAILEIEKAKREKR